MEGGQLPSWLKPVGVSVAIVFIAVLLAGELGVPYRALQPPKGYDQSRLLWNTKNSTRFAGTDLGVTAGLVSRAVYPATEAANTPDLVILYAAEDWQGGLVAASLLRPLNAILLPAVPAVAEEIARLHPKGSALLDGTQILLLNGATVPTGAGSSRSVRASAVPDLLKQAGFEPHNAIVVDPDDPGTALLAAPWAAYSGDLIVFAEQDVPSGLATYALGEAQTTRATRISAGGAEETAVAFARYADPHNATFGWGFNADTTTGYRAYTLARKDDPSTALLSANLARRGKPGPLLWTGADMLPTVIDNYIWSQRAAFWVTPSEGPFDHFWVLGDRAKISFPAQSRADYAVEIGPYKEKGVGMSGLDMLAAVWIMLGFAAALWITFHAARFLPGQTWLMRLAWPLLALMLGPFGLVFYLLAYGRPFIRHGKMTMWDRPVWLQALVATVGSVGFGGLIMVCTGFVMTLFGLPLIASEGPLFWLGAPMVLVMIASYVVAVLISWPLYQAPMLAMFHGRPYAKALLPALPVVALSMASVSLAMFPGMWWLMMTNLPMMPAERSILWFGVMLFTVFMGFLISWPFNYLFVRKQIKSGLM